MHYLQTTVKQMQSQPHSLWWRMGGLPGEGGGECLGPCSQAGHGVVRRATEGCLRTFYLSFQKHKGGGKHMDCGSRISQLSNPGSLVTSLSPIVSSVKNGEEHVVLGWL